MEKDLELNSEKKLKIINSGLSIFSCRGYKKTSINDIAICAGVSKALIFHYFKNKKSLFLFLLKYCIELTSSEIKTKLSKSETDFFKAINLTQRIKINMLKKHPEIFNFLAMAYVEKSEEVKPEINLIFQEEIELGFNFVFKYVDFSKFKQNCSPDMASKIVMWCAEGFINCLPKIQEIDVEAVCNEFEKYLVLLRNSFYKEEFL